MFINGNGMLYLYKYIKNSDIITEKIFFKTCEHIYKIDRECAPNICLSNLQKIVDIIKDSYRSTNDDDYARLFFIVLRMVNRLKMWNEIILSEEEIYSITKRFVYPHLNEKNSHYPRFFINISKVWSGILNTSKTFKIGSIEKLVYLAAIFSIDLLGKMRYIDKDSTFNITPKKEQRLYIIYLTLIADDVFNHKKSPWLPPILINLHTALQDFIQKYPINHMKIQDQFIILQYYIKSCNTLKLKMSLNGLEIFRGFFAMTSSNPDLSNTF
ncbi:hypothetical protein RF11_07450 [Thelohanellus kitauei]|uniref:Uncharacterized protein n=1 Tax=Thelohanellus kitauei TaxID=669202 RepID=A0A0C2MTB9_THEKT|nr:hypothetical protein RF11_07450 [Thelohanellus kitauei]